jgi:hypothetical protein
VKRGALYVGVGNNYSGPPSPTTDAVLAFDLKSGKMRWARQMAPGPADVFGCIPGEVNCGDRSGPDFDFGASPALTTLPGGRDLIVAGRSPASPTRSIPTGKASRSGDTAPAVAAVSAAFNGAWPWTPIARKSCR